jgi:hypothetical protein
MKKLATMRDALSDPALLAGALPGESWAAWRVILIACAGEALRDEEREVFKALTGREREPGVMVEVLLAVAGRRSGKTKAIAVFAVYLATLCDWSDDLSIGEHGLALFLAPTERQAAVAHDYATGVVDHVALLAGKVASRTATTLTLQRGIEHEVQAAHWRFSRGATAICVALDECAFLYSSEDSANGDAELLTALRPSLATTGGPMLLTSSPAAMEGIVYQLHKRHYGPQGDPLVMVIQADTRTLNPSLRQSVVNRAYATDPVGADSEYGGRFRQPTTAYLERSLIEAAVSKGLTRKGPLPGVRYYAHIDVSGGNGTDSFTASIAHKVFDRGREVCVLNALFEVRPKFDPDQAVAECAAMLRVYGITSAYSDNYAAQWPVTAFARHGVAVMKCPLTASELYMHSVPAWTASRVQMLDNDRAVDQLAALKRKLGQGGRETIEHPRGAHDDLANVIAGVIWRLTPAQAAVPMVGAKLYNLRTGAEIFVDNSVPSRRDIHTGAPLARHDEAWRGHEL